MKKIILIFILLAIPFISVKATSTESRLLTKIEGLKQIGHVFHPVQLLKYKETAHLDGTGDYVIYDIDNAKLRDVYRANYNSINFILPMANGKILEIYLTKNEIFTDDFEATITNELGRKPVNPGRGNLYHGIINNSGMLSLACVSIFSNELSAVISDESGNWNLGKLDGRNDSEYAYFNDHTFHLPIAFRCETEDEESGEGHINNIQPESMAPINKCVRLFIDCDYDFFVFKGSNINNVFTYVENLFNVSSTIYGQEDVSIAISSLNFWTFPDPFADSSSAAGLNDFKAHYLSNSWNGDNAHLLARDGGNGGRANISAICDGYAYSDIFGSYSASSLTFPTYTWDANVFTHELGHNFGSRHTHWCGWVGGPIDSCNTCWTNLAFEGSCTTGGPIPAQGGTMMSYCHGCSVGVSFLEGFGSQPGNAIRSHIASKTCLTNCSGVCRLFTSVGVPITTGNNLTFQSVDVTFGSNTVESGATATFNGGYLVMLNPGFFAQNGCTFLASIASCTPFQSPSNSTGTITKNDLNSDKEDFAVYPNPFTNTLTVEFYLSKDTDASIMLLDVMGREIKTISKSFYTGGRNEVRIDASEVPTGIYFVILQTTHLRKEQKLVKMN